MTDHKQVPVNYRGKEILVDEELAPLLQLLWKFRFETINSCQCALYHSANLGFPKAWIEFKGGESILRLLRILQETPQVDSRILGFPYDYPSKTSFFSEFWIYRTRVRQQGRELEVCSSVFFPPTDIPTIQKRLEEALEQIKDLDTLVFTWVKTGLCVNVEELTQKVLDFKGDRVGLTDTLCRLVNGGKLTLNENFGLSPSKTKSLS